MAQTTAPGSDHELVAKLTFVPFPQSLKGWTSKERPLNRLAIRSFRDVADADYIAARLAKPNASERLSIVIQRISRFRRWRSRHVLQPRDFNVQGVVLRLSDVRSHEVDVHGERTSSELKLEGQLRQFACT
jgi:hypothetical protein